MSDGITKEQQERRCRVVQTAESLATWIKPDPKSKFRIFTLAMICEAIGDKCCAELESL